MVDLVITAANVVADSTAQVISGTAGVAIAAGQVVYLDPATQKYLLADNNGSVDAKSPAGIALHGAALNQPIDVARVGPVTVGPVLTAGVAYYLSDVAGGICPVADLLTGETATIIGMARTTSVLNVQLHKSGVTLP